MKKLFVVILGLSMALGCAPNKVVLQSTGVEAPPQDWVEEVRLSPFYKKFVSSDGFPIVASNKVHDAALQEAAYIVSHLLKGQDKLRHKMLEKKARLLIMAHNEYVTDIPEYKDLGKTKENKDFWDRRSRGIGRKTCLCAEENLLMYDGDPRQGENILIHEFAHVIHLTGFGKGSDFDKRLKAIFKRSREKGLWEGTYAGTYSSELWAEAVQSWFDANRQNNADHNHVNTREELKAYDPELAALCEDVFGDVAWRYVNPFERGAEYVKNFNREEAPTFKWRN